VSSSVRLILVVVLALLAARGVQASASASTVTPSAARAKHATRLEVLTRYTILDAHTHHPAWLRVDCNRLTKRLYRCSFSGQTVTDLYVYVVSGKSMVRFDKQVHARLHGVSCSTYNTSNIPYDFRLLTAACRAGHAEMRSLFFDHREPARREIASGTAAASTTELR
jgi:hypothetical protein